MGRDDRLGYNWTSESLRALGLSGTITSVSDRTEHPSESLEGEGLDTLNERFEGAEPREVIRWAADRFRPDVALSSSFQSQSLPLLHMVADVAPELPVIFLDTGYHFPETLEFRDRVVDAWGLNLRVMKAALSRDEFVNRHGDDLFRRDPDLCCFINKVEPMRRATEELEAWIAGIRRDQTTQRSSIETIERRDDGLIRVHPLARWTDQDVWRYIDEHDLPTHPLLEEGYLSIGCAPCTRPVGRGETGRDGRWCGSDKSECGLHTTLRDSDEDEKSPVDKQSKAS